MSETLDQALVNARVALKALEDVHPHIVVARSCATVARSKLQPGKKTRVRRASDRLDRAKDHIERMIFDMKVVIAELESEMKP